MSSKDESQGPGQGGQDEEESTFRLDQEITRKYDPTALSKLIVRDAGRGEALDLHTRSRMQQHLGGDFSNVRVIRGPLAEEVTSRYRADAVTVGGTELILVREGWQSNFQSAEGAALLAHELTHVQQSQRGLHFATHGHDDADSETEAPAYGVQAMVQAAESGRNIMEEAMKRQLLAERKVWEEVKKAAKEAMKKMKELGDIRSGNANVQSRTT